MNFVQYKEKHCLEMDSHTCLSVHLKVFLDFVCKGATRIRTTHGAIRLLFILRL